MTALARPSMTALFVALLVGAMACSGDPAPKKTPPATVEPDDRFVVLGRTWYLEGNSLTASHEHFDLTVYVAPGTDFVDAWIDDAPGVRLKYSEGTYVLRLPIAEVTDDFGVGEHRLRLAADGKDVAFADVTLYRSHPLYAVLATDWDFSDPSDEALDAQDTLHAENPDLKITHFVGPYTFTDPELADARVDELVTWLGAQAALGDEIALHIHPYCNFVEHAGVTCITDQSIVYTAGDATGYTINLSAYDQASMETLLDAADALFIAAGLPKPTSFRAGGWTSGGHTLAALANSGYVTDSSALNWARVEEWEGVQNGELYRWNSENWAPINDSSQPYYPNQESPATDAAPTLSILEVPDNGVMTDYVTVAEMSEIVAAIWDANALPKPATFVFGFHPAPGTGINSTDVVRLRGIVAELGLHLASKGDGPVVYETMSALSTLTW